MTNKNHAGPLQDKQHRQEGDPEDGPQPASSRFVLVLLLTILCRNHPSNIYYKVEETLLVFLFPPMSGDVGAEEVGHVDNRE